LNKYNLQVPTSWSELIKVAQTILENEKEIGNTDLIGYNGLFLS